MIASVRTRTARRRLAQVGVAGTFALGVLVPAAAASADATCYTNCTPPSVQPATQVQGATASRGTTTTSTLPFTGGDIAGLVAIGAGATLVGVTMVRRARRAPVDAS